MSATLKDLAPGEKQKVARLIQQVVEKERALKEVEAAAAERGEATSATAQQLAEQNMELARENTSLRAKLSTAFDLLRTYQHKCRVLDATAQITGSRTASPSCASPASVAAMAGGWAQPGVDAQLLAGRLSLLGTTQDACTSAAPEMAPGRESSRQLSPVAEGAWEGCSPRQAMASAAADPLQPLHLQPNPLSSTLLSSVAAGASDRSACLVQQALPQLESLKMLAQALLEAQAEVAAKQHQHQQAAEAVLPSLVLPSAAGGALMFDASLGSHGGYLISQPLPCNASARVSCSIGVSRGQSDGSEQQAQDAGAADSGVEALGTGRAGLMDVQPQAPAVERPSSCSGSSSSRCGGRELAYDDSLMSLVRDVENMAQHQQHQQHSSGGGSSMETGQRHGSCCSGWGPLHGAPCSEGFYEENDLIDLISQL